MSIRTFDQSEISKVDPKTLPPARLAASWSGRTKIVAINMPTAEVRRQKFTQRYQPFGQRLPFEFFPAVVGKDLLFESTTKIGISVVYDPTRNRHWISDLTRPYCKQMIPAVYGASLSHLQILERLVHDPDYDSYIIMEDDTDLADDITIDRVIEYLANVPDQYDLIQLNSQVAHYPLELIRPVNHYYFEIRRRWFNCAASYLVSKSGARKLLDYAGPGVVSRPPDDLLSNAFIENKINVLAPYQALFTVDLDLPLDIVYISDESAIFESRSVFGFPPR